MSGYFNRQGRWQAIHAYDPATNSVVTVVEDAEENTIVLHHSATKAEGEEKLLAWLQHGDDVMEEDHLCSQH